MFGLRSVLVLWVFTGCAAPVDVDDTRQDGSGSEGTDTGSADTGEEGQPSASDYGAMGPYEVISGETGADCTVFHPANLGEGGLKHPVILWGNGTYMTVDVYAAGLKHWASHGFIVAAANTSWAGTGKEMLDCLDYLTAENTRAGSTYEGRVDVDHVGASGHSQGGGGTLMAGMDPRITATAPLQPYTEQGWGGYDQVAQSQQVGAMFMMSGSADTIAPPQPNQQRVWDTTNVETFWGMLDGADHLASAMGEMTDYRGPTVAWMRFHLMGDEAAGELFYGPCELCEASDWDIQHKQP